MKKKPIKLPLHFHPTKKMISEFNYILIIVDITTPMNQQTRFGM